MTAGAGNPRTRAVFDPFAAVSASTGSASLPFVLAPAPSGGDDYAALQALMDSNCPIGIAVVLRAAPSSAPYLISAELQIKSTYKAGLFGAGGNHLGASGTVIKATGAMRSCVAYLSPALGLSVGGYLCDAAGLATYAHYFSWFDLCTAENLAGINAILDGFYVDGNDTHFVDGSTFTNCIGANNGTTRASAGILAEFLYGTRAVIAGTAQVTAGTTIVITGGPDLTTLNIRKGDPCRVGAGTSQALSALSSVGTTATATTATAHGLSDQQIVTISGCTPAAYNVSATITRVSDTQFRYSFVGAGVVTVLGNVSNPSAAQYAQIESVSATTITLQGTTRNQMTVTAAGQEYAFGTGDGFHDNRTIGAGAGANSNTNNIIGGLWRSNGANGLNLAGLFGDTIIGGMIDFGNWYGISLGHSDNNAASYQFAAFHPYFEGLAAGSIWFGQVVDPVIISPTWANQKYRHRGVYSNPGWIIGSNIEHVQSGIQQNFIIDIFNNGGTLQHRFISDWQNASVASAVDAINGATNAATNTPEGATALDATHGFAAGGGIVAADTGIFLFDVSPQITFRGSFTIERNPIVGLVGVWAYLNSFSVNGVTRMRLGFHTTDAAGAGIAISAANIPAGQHFSVRFEGYINVS